MEPDRQPISPDHWQICLQVLRRMAEEPEAAPDQDTFGRLLADVYRRHRRSRRKQSKHERQQHDRQLLEQTALVAATPVGPLPSAGKPPLRTPLPPPADENSQQRNAQRQSAGNEFRSVKSKSRSCYICHQHYRDMHFLYHMLCPQCAEINYRKRLQRVDLQGRYAVVTGGRIKIGYQVALRLLRDGAQVTVTTRFAKDALQRYAAEPDFQAWAERLRICCIDFRQLKDVVAFGEYLLHQLPWLDILVNNAAQSVRRPPEYFAHYAAIEAQPLPLLPPACQDILSDYGGPPTTCVTDIHSLPMLGIDKLGDCLDKYGEPLDMRDSNSWTLLLHEVSLLEMLEVQLINTVAPFMLTSRLKELLLRSPFPDRFVVNVCGVDGIFARSHKAATHPHVNMSKAALNMMTRTSAEDWARDRIFMNSCDTGWASLLGKYSRIVELREKGIAPPLDEIDGAARIYDPIVQGILGNPVYGKLLRHYGPAEW